MTFKIGNQYGKLGKRGKGKYKINAKLKQDIQVIVDELLSSIKIQDAALKNTATIGYNPAHNLRSL